MSDAYWTFQIFVTMRSFTRMRFVGIVDRHGRTRGFRGLDNLVVAPDLNQRGSRWPRAPTKRPPRLLDRNGRRRQDLELLTRTLFVMMKFLQVVLLIVSTSS